MRSLRTLFLLAVLISLGGCSSPSGQTNLFCPGTASYQQRRAERFDPYANASRVPRLSVHGRASTSGPSPSPPEPAGSRKQDE